MPEIIHRTGRREDDRIIRGLSITERLRAARHVPQAVVKVVTFAHGAKRARQLLSYMTREGTLPLELASGDTLRDMPAQMELVRHWAAYFDPRRRSRDVGHIVFSMPRGFSPEALQRSTRAVLHQRFPNHDWALVIHEDRQHPHAHVALVMRGRSLGPKLDFRKADLYDLRERFAAAAREEGVELAVTPRAARGVGRKAETQSVHHLRRRGIVPAFEKETVSDILDSKPGRRRLPKPWEKALIARNLRERGLYLAQAAQLRQQAQTLQGEAREKLLAQARTLENFARHMPQPHTFRQEVLHLLGVGPGSLRDAAHRNSPSRQEPER